MASSLIQSLRSFDVTQCTDELQRLELLSATRRLFSNMQTPTERAMDLFMGNPLVTTVTRILIEQQLFMKWKDHGNGPKTAAELATLIDMDPRLLRRFLMLLVSYNQLDQADGEAFVPSRATEALTKPVGNNLPVVFSHIINPLMQGLPEYLKKHGFTQPQDPVDGIIQSCLNEPGKDVYTILESRPDLGKSFHIFMEEWGKYRPYWLEIYPSESLIVDGEKPILVDVGAGTGHDLQRFSDKHPGHADRLVLVDRPEVVTHTTCDSKIQVVAHDFFNPMPVHGARAYYLKAVLHNWPDSYAIKILENVKSAMTPGYSRILINDMIMPATKPRVEETVLDLMMMSVLSSLERTEAQWREIVSAAGLKVIKIWTSPLTVEGVIEVALNTE